MNGKQILKDVYALIAELWCSPPEADAERAEIRKEAEEVVKRLESIDKESAMLLSRFLRENDISEEDYIDLFELDPQCPLYLGSHTYDEPTTCATAAVSDRNGNKYSSMNLSLTESSFDSVVSERKSTIKGR